MDSDNTIQNFLIKDQCGKIIKTKHMLEKEQDRVEKVKQAREKALQLAMEKSAKLILNERKYESNTKRHEQMVKEEDDYRMEKFAQYNDKCKEKRQRTIDHDEHINELGYARYKKDNKKRELDLEQAKQRDLSSARESFLKLRMSMEVTERKQRENEENFNRSALEAKKTL